MSPGPTVALMGNPNVGKSTIFNAVTGLRQHTGNWPGKTVASAEGRFTHQGARCSLVDLPGTYSLSARSPEEEVAERYLRSGAARAVIVVCDATALARSLPLALEVLAITRRTVICVNLMDEAAKKGICVDTEKLSAALGVPVIGVTGRKKATLSPLLDAAVEMADVETEEPPMAAGTAAQRSARVKELLADAVTYPAEDIYRRDRRLDRLFTSRALGYPLMALLLCGVFWLTMEGANVPSEWLGKLFGRLGEILSGALTAAGAPGWLHDALILGVYRMVSWVVSVMLPPMAIFFPLFTLLEDAGYLPRVAFNLDGPFRRCRSCGKQALTMSMGLGCNAVGVMGCRIIDSPRERLLAILTNSFVPCNGRFPMLLVMIGLFSGTGSVLTAAAMTGVILFGILCTFLATRALSATVLKGVPSAFVLELPPYRRPQIGPVLVRSVLDRTLFVLGRAVSVAAPAGLLLWAMASVTVGDVTLLRLAAEALEPLGRLLGMDGVLLLAFLLGFPANETVLPIALMIYLSHRALNASFSVEEIRSILLSNGWTPVTALCAMVFSLLHWPCSTTLLTVRKETGSWRWTALAAALPTGFGVTVCLLIHLISQIFTT